MKRQTGWGEKTPAGPTHLFEILPYMLKGDRYVLLHSLKSIIGFGEIDEVTLPLLSLSKLLSLKTEHNEPYNGIIETMQRANIWFVKALLVRALKAHDKDKKLGNKYHQRLNQTPRNPRKKR